MPEIRFSIIITSYNQREFIKDAVDSALSQRHAKAEVIVVDDCSTDGTQEILRQYGDSIRLVCRETNGKSSVARNCGTALARGEYLVFLDGDDAFLPWAMDVYEQVVEANNPTMILPSLRHFQGTLPAPQEGHGHSAIRIVEYADFLRKDRTAASGGGSLVIERRVLERMGGWPEDIWPMEDHHFMLKLGECGRLVLILTPPTLLRRMHAQNSIRNVPAYLSSIQAVIRNERLGKYPGGKRRRYERRALIGGYALTWAAAAIKGGLLWDASKLIASTWPMGLAAVTRKVVVRLRGRQAPETLEMPKRGLGGPRP